MSPQLTSKSLPLSRRGMVYMLLLSIQFGVQPSLTKRYISTTCNTSACRSSVVLVQETIRFLMAATMLVASGKWSDAVSGWSIYSWMTVAGIPSSLYCIQNLASLLAFENLDPITFNVLNQTKTLSAALWCFLIMGRKQSRVQVLNLFMLLTSSLVVEDILTLDILNSMYNSVASNGQQHDRSSFSSVTSSRHFTHGVVPVLFASLLSGLASAISQKNLQGSSFGGISQGRNSFLFSMELCSASVLIISVSLLSNEDGATMRRNGFFDRWTPRTFIPILTNSAGGIVVGLVTKYAGSVMKGFSVVFGMVLSGIIHAFTDSAGVSGITKGQAIGGSIAAFSLAMHCTHPYQPPKTLMSTTPGQTQASNGEANVDTLRKRSGFKMLKEE